mmetsp:Transcript_1296/g.2725  ORF Transcript_1296/g.2725 Transcript_1296/m.2725 type:complete len:239 (+) Transcript_1296:339-1055(+)
MAVLERILEEVCRRVMRVLPVGSIGGAIFGEIGDQIFVTVLVLVGEQVIGRRVVVGFVPGSETLAIALVLILAGDGRRWLCAGSFVDAELVAVAAHACSLCRAPQAAPALPAVHRGRKSRTTRQAAACCYGICGSHSPKGATRSTTVVDGQDGSEATHGAGVSFGVHAGDDDALRLSCLCPFLCFLRLQRAVDDNGAVWAFEGRSGAPGSRLDRFAGGLACLGEECTWVAMVGCELVA